MQRDCLIIGIYLSRLTRLSRQVLDRPRRDARPYSLHFFDNSGILAKTDRM